MDMIGRFWLEKRFIHGKQIPGPFNHSFEALAFL
jgi:hypothetical protein